MAKDQDNMKLLVGFLIGIIVLMFIFYYYAPKTEVDDDFFAKLRDLLGKYGGQAPSNGDEGDVEEPDVESEDNYCSDTDGGKSYYVPGHITTEQDVYYDKCEDARALTEYWCDGNNAKSSVFFCPDGYECFQTRSGGLCSLILEEEEEGWEVGDVVGGINTGGNLIPGDEYVSMEIDLSHITAGGDCYLGAKIWTSWDYLVPEMCWGTQGTEMVDWVFYDSTPPPEILATETYPQSSYHELCPRDYDGKTNWELKMFKLLNIPGCEITWTAKVEVFICECD